MRNVRAISTALALSLTILGGGYANLAAPTPAHADPIQANSHFHISPAYGSAAGDTDVPITPYPVVGVKFIQISSRLNHTLAIGDDGNTYAWGDNTYGQLGDGTTTQRLTPVKVKVPTGVKFTQVSAGGEGAHSLARDENGNAYAWGHNNKGQLGFGDTTDRLTPQKITLPSGIHFGRIIAGNDFSIGSSSDYHAGLFTWGNNADGQLGVGDNNIRTTPTLVADLGYNSMISTRQSTVMVDANPGSGGNKIYAWGGNQYGQLLTGDRVNRNAPVSINPPSGVNYLANIHLGAGTANSGSYGDTIYSWGQGGRGQMGDGSGNTGADTLITTLQQVTFSMPAGVKVVSLSRGNWHAIAVGDDRKMYAWGNNWYGALGNSSTPTGVPVNVSNDPSICATPTLVELPTGVTTTNITTGDWNSFAIGDDGNTYAWGRNDHGQLGDGTTIDRYTPVRVGSKVNITKVTFDGASASGTTNPVSSIWTGKAPAHPAGQTTVTIEWKLNGIPQPSETYDFKYLAAHTVTFKSGKPGDSDIKQTVLDGNYASYPTPAPSWATHAFNGWYVDGHLYDFGTQITQDLTLTAQWGDFTSMSPTSGPTRGYTDVSFAAPPGIRFTQIAVGTNGGIAIGNDAHTYQWQEDFQNRRMTQVKTPVQFVKISAGKNHNLALGVDGKVYAWGSNYAGQLGIQTDENGITGLATIYPPVQVTMPDTIRIISISAGGLHSLALTENGTVYSWGSKNQSQLGDGVQPIYPQYGGSWSGRAQPQPIRTSIKFKAVFGGKMSSFAIALDGTPYAWGGLVTLGTPAGSDPNIPTAVDTNVKFKSISVGENTVMGLTEDGKAYGWGGNYFGQIGAGNIDPNTNQVNPQSVNVPTQTNTSLRFKSISVGGSGDATLAITEDGTAYTWGCNYYGLLGNGSKDSLPHVTPTKLKTDLKYIALNANDSFTNWLAANGFAAGIAADGNIYSWGDTWSAGDRYLSPKQIPSPQPIVTQVKFGSTPGIYPHFNDNSWNGTADYKWHVYSPPHTPDETVDVEISWTLGGVAQEPIKFKFRYYSYFDLPAAGAIPLQRLSGGMLLALTAAGALIYAGFAYSKRKRGRHVGLGRRRA
ncbi:hypothetical protein KIM372_14120 [Bombiscardovia nodaiensis]|uniref:RCC1-like domain-containing protein n=1 Tax=Bombiscardovia nodaiensis TaxID=2932181 RepID=A0ABM8B9E4_9BIFI|nr:hypothetical protein KIM372_14120 [Bombiscardovia nodaiensis]